MNLPGDSWGKRDTSRCRDILASRVVWDRVGEDDWDMLGTEAIALCSLEKGEACPLQGKPHTVQKPDQLSKTAEMTVNTEMGISGKAQGPFSEKYLLDQKQRTEEQGQRGCSSCLGAEGSTYHLLETWGIT